MTAVPEASGTRTTPHAKTEICIAGMTCAMCAKAIETSIMDLPGAISAQVNLGKETALVEWDPEKVRLVDIEKAVAEAGYQVIDERAVMKVGGMTCVMCSRAIENALSSLEGGLRCQREPQRRKGCRHLQSPDDNAC